MKPPEVALRGLALQWLDKAAADFEAADHGISLPAGGGEVSKSFSCSPSGRVSENARYREVVDLLG